MKFPKAIADIIPPANDQPHKEFAEEQNCNTVAGAESLFTIAAKRLQQPHLWKELTGLLGAEFESYSAPDVVGAGSGKPFEGMVKAGDLLKIKVGGPLPLGNDWVKVSHLISDEEKDVEAVALQVHPCAPPVDEAERGTETKTEHFFDECATSTWVICRRGKMVSAHYRGRQEVPNKESKDLLRNIRDKVVAAAAMVGLADLQWKALLKGLLQTEEGPKK